VNGTLLGVLAWKFGRWASQLLRLHRLTKPSLTPPESPLQPLHHDFVLAVHVKCGTHMTGGEGPKRKRELKRRYLSGGLNFGWDGGTSPPSALVRYLRRCKDSRSDKLWARASQQEKVIRVGLAT